MGRTPRFHIIQLNLGNYFISFKAMAHKEIGNSFAQIVLPSTSLNEDITFFTRVGFRLDNIYPSDDPAVAMMSGNGLHIVLDVNSKTSPVTIHIRTDEPQAFGGQTELKAPNGSVIRIVPQSYRLELPETQHRFEVRKLRDSDPWVIGRAGMLYRDLIPDRLGGSIIASHIRIPNGGPVPDMVHYHTIGFQLIFCYRGWVKLVYEDQGPPFVLKEGDCVTQPPEIRHRVLEASENVEVIEIGVPAEHMTTIDHDLELPTKTFNPDREFNGQFFCHHEVSKATWHPWRIDGFEFRETGVSKATRGVASVHVARPTAPDIQTGTLIHDGDILFTFVMEGEVTLNGEGHDAINLKRGDAFVIPPNFKHHLGDNSDDLELLEVSLPGDFQTTVLDQK